MKNRFEEVYALLQKSPHTFVVTGGAGFIGSHLTEKLLSLGQTVRVVDNFATGHKKNIEPFFSDKNFSFFEGSVADTDLMKRVMDGAEYVLHQGALGSVPRSIENPTASHLANVHGFLTTIDAARVAKVKAFVYASSSSVYGDSPILPKKEEHIGKLLSPYAATKAINELYAETYHTVYGVHCTGLRYFNVFGPRQDPNGAYAAVIPRWIATALKGESLPINGDGSVSRDFCYIDNVVQANILAALTPEASGEVFNIACGDRTTLMQIHDALWEAVSSSTKTARKEPKFNPVRAGDIPHSLADISHAQKILGYTPTVRVHEGLLKTVKAFSV